jgi:hypothetical protein
VELRHIVYLILTLIIAITAFTPIIIPLTPTDYVQDAYETIMAIQPGDLVVEMSGQMSLPGYEMSRGSYVAQIKVMLERGANILIWTGSEQTTSFVRELWSEAVGQPFQTHPDYGTRFVYLGFLPGGDEIVIPSLYQDIRLVRTEDDFGNSLNDFTKLPMMADITSLWDADLMYGGSLNMVRSIDTQIPFVLAHSNGGNLPIYVGWYKAGLAQGVVSGSTASAQFEALTGYPGIAQERLIQNVAVTAFVMLGSIATSIGFIVGRGKFGTIMEER